MKNAFRRGIHIFPLLIFMIFNSVVVTLCWQSMNQSALNENSSDRKEFPVELVLYEKLPDGTLTEIPLPDGVFRLFRENGKELSGQFITNENGRIFTRLPVGEYYFEELTPPVGYYFDVDENGAVRKKYPFSVTDRKITESDEVTYYEIPMPAEFMAAEVPEPNAGMVDGTAAPDADVTDKVPIPNDADAAGEVAVPDADVTDKVPKPVEIVAYNIPGEGTLTVEKQVKNGDGSSLSEVQLEQEFTFTVTFSDSGTYAYSIDGEEAIPLESGKTLTLKHGQRAIFSAIPAGVTYQVEEQPASGYVVSSDGSIGIIAPDGCVARFFNIFGDVKTGGLVIMKKVVTGSEFVPAPSPEQPPESETVPAPSPEQPPESETVPASSPEQPPESETVPDLSPTQPVSPADTLFAFVVTFSDDGSYPYRINGGDPILLESGGILYLRDGEQAEIIGLPVGVKYTVSEQHTEGYQPTVSDYSGIITANRIASLPFVNVRGQGKGIGSLEIKKEIIGNIPNPNMEFTFTVTFSDGGTYAYSIDGGEAILLESGGTLVLKHSQTALFPDLPDGVSYMVEETDPKGYLPAFTVQRGFVVGGEKAEAYFINHVPEESVIRVTKLVVGECHAVAEDFRFTLIVNGVEIKFVLKPNETKEFSVPADSDYEVREEQAPGFIQKIENGVGKALSGQITEVVVTNICNEGGKVPDSPDVPSDPPEAADKTVKITGQKIWYHGENAEELRPDSIVVRLYADGELKEQRLVMAADDWKYSFTKPKFAQDGHEIVYTIDEIPVPGYKGTISGYDLINTYISPEVPDSPDVPIRPQKPDQPVQPGEPIPTDQPKTEDTSHIGLWITLMLCSSTGFIITTCIRLRRHRRTNRRKQMKSNSRHIK